MNPRIYLLLLFTVVGVFFILIQVHSYQSHLSQLNSQNPRTIANLRQKVADRVITDPSTQNNPQISTKKMSIPGLVYGTAWKKDRTKELVHLAVKSGFRAIDTACQPKHYYEPGVGEALQQLYNENIITRADIFIQTKFTPLRGQDPNNIPYDKTKSTSEQILQSFEVSCNNLKTDYLDSLLLHSPFDSISDTLTAWKTFESIVEKGGVRAIGLSNTYDIETIKKVYDAATVKPSYLQNRFYRDSNYDVEIRKYCQQVGIQYQSFWTLTANPHITRSSIVQSLARKYSKTPAQIFFRFVKSLGITILTGTTSQQHMLEDLAILDESFVLEESELKSIATLLY